MKCCFVAFAFSDCYACPIRRWFCVAAHAHAVVDIVPMMVCLYGGCFCWWSSPVVLFRHLRFGVRVCMGWYWVLNMCCGWCGWVLQCCIVKRC